MQFSSFCLVNRLHHTLVSSVSGLYHFFCPSAPYTSGSFLAFRCSLSQASGLSLWKRKKPLHCIMLHHTTLHYYITVHSTILHCITLHDTTLNYNAPHHCTIQYWTIRASIVAILPFLLPILFL